MDTLVQQLENCCNTGNIQDGLQILQQIKLVMITASSQDALNYTNQYINALELGALLAVAAEDLDNFNRTIQQLRPYYSNTNNATTSASSSSSPRKNQILGLNLMLLLVENRLSEFHSELELLSADEQADAFIQFPIALERKMMVGIYDEVLQMTLPDASYQFFMNQLNQTVRDSIADCMEVAYPQLSIQQACEIMKCSNEQELMEYISTVRDDWIVNHDSNMITFQPDAVNILPPTSNDNITNQISTQDIPSMQWIQQALAYATEMERIV